jgi:hypothetical protein
VRQPYPWLQAYLKAHLNELKGLRNHDIKKAVGWFNSLLKYFRQRNLSTPRQQKNYVVDVRNEIKSRFGEDHPALQVVGFDAETWTQINQPIHDRVEDRLQNTRFLTNPDAIVERAETLLSSKTSTWADLAVGLGVVIGRRLSELLGYRTKLQPKTEFSILFTGQLKSYPKPDQGLLCKQCLPWFAISRNESCLAWGSKVRHDVHACLFLYFRSFPRSSSQLRALTPVRDIGPTP